MTDRIRITGADIAHAPDSPQVPGRASNAPAPGGGEVFGHVRAQSERGAVSGGGIWSKPKVLFTVAGIAAAVFSSVVTDGIGGMGRYEAAGSDTPWWIGLLFMGSFCAAATAFIAAADDIAAGAFERASLFGAIGFALGFIGGLIAVVAGGFAMMFVQAIFFGDGWRPHSDVDLVWAGVLSRSPGWLIAGALCGLMVGALGRSVRRAFLGAAGGAVGGLVGGLLFDPLCFLFGRLEPGSSAVLSRVVGLSVMGATTGLAIAFAEQAAKQAWLSIERGRLIGKQFIIYRNPTRIGASYSNDVFLFKDTTVQPEHARISRRGGGYVIEAMAGALVRVNGQPVAAGRIGNGETLQIGETVMRFNVKS